MAIPAVRTPLKLAIKVALVVAFWVALTGTYFYFLPITGFVAKAAVCILLEAVLLGAAGYGYWMRRRLLPASLSTGEAILFDISLGLGALALLMFGLGIARAWTRIGAWVLVAIGLALFVRALKYRPFQNYRTLRLSTLPPIPILLLLTSLVLSFILAFAPITYYDSLTYHFALPAIYQRAHGWIPLPSFMYSAFPQNTELWWLLGNLLCNDALANLLNWSISVLILLAIFEGGRRFIDGKTAWWSMALFAVMPAFLLLSSGGYVETPLALFTLLSLYALLLWRASPASSALLTASGFFVGIACGIKYTAAIPFAIGVCFIGIISWRSGIKRVAGDVLRYGIPAALTVSPWLIKNAVYFGNPVFPFFYHYGAGKLNPWTNSMASTYFAGLMIYQSHALWEIPKLFWDILVHGMDYGGGMDVLGNFGWAPLAILLPCVAWMRKRSAVIYLLLGYFVLFFVSWGISRPVLRFLFPLAPVMAWLAGAGWVKGVGRMPEKFRQGSAILLGGFIVSGFLIFFEIASRMSLFGVAMGLQRRDEYLMRHLTYYAAATVVNRLPPSARVYVLGDQRRYYYTGNVEVPTIFNPNPMIEWANAAKSGEDLLMRIKSAGYSHILINYDEMARLAPYHVFDLSEHGRDNWSVLENRLSHRVYADHWCEVLAL